MDEKPNIENVITLHQMIIKLSQQHIEMYRRIAELEAELKDRDEVISDCTRYVETLRADLVEREKTIEALQGEYDDWI